MKIVVPMAGRGKRFADESDINREYSVMKPMIKIFNKPMIQWAMESYISFLQQSEDETDKPVLHRDTIFICLKEHEEQFEISDFLKSTFSDKINILFTEKVTRGPAETALLAKNFIDSDEDIIVSDSDHHFDGRDLWRVIQQKHPEPNFLGILPLMRPDDTEPTWSYVVLNDSNEVTDIREKDVELAKQLAYGVIGAYYFKRGRYFVDEAKKMIKENDLSGDAEKMEFYMSKVYQRYIAKGFLVKSAFINKGWVLGTPKHLNKFIQTVSFRGEIL